MGVTGRCSPAERIPARRPARAGSADACRCGRLVRDLPGGTSPGAIGKRRTAGRRGHPDSGPASAGVREFHPGRARGRAAGGVARHLGVAADAGDVRARRAAAPAAGAVSGLPGAERRVRRPVLAAVRVGRAGHGDLRPGGRVPAVAGVSAAAVRQGAGAGPRAAAGRDAGPHRGGGLGLLPSLPHRAGAGPAGTRRPGHAVERAVRRRAPPGRRHGASQPARPPPAAGGRDIAGRPGAGHRRGGGSGRAARRTTGDPHRAGWDRQDPAGGGGGRAAGRPLRGADRVRPAGRGHRAGAGAGGRRPGGGGGAGRVGLAAGGPGRVLRRRPVATHPGQPRAGGRRGRRHRRAADPLSGAW